LICAAAGWGGFRGNYMKPRRLVWAILCALTLFVFSAPGILAQTQSTGALTGTVKDPSGAVIAGAKVTVKNLSTGLVRSVTTDSKGSYQVS